MVDIQHIEQCVKKLTKEPRFIHSKGVEYMAGELAAHYGVDVRESGI